MDQWVATSHNKNQKEKNKMSDFALIKYNDVKSFNITHLDFLLESYIHTYIHNPGKLTGGSHGPTNPTSLLNRVFSSHLTKPSFPFTTHDMIFVGKIMHLLQLRILWPTWVQVGLFCIIFYLFNFHHFLEFFFFFFPNGFSLCTLITLLQA